MSSTRALIQRAVPIAVSLAILAWLLRAVDLRALADAMSWRVAAWMVPGFAVYGAVTLWLEAVSLGRPLETVSSRVSRWTLARIKCASYLLGIVNYALGAAALSVLLQRRAEFGLARAAGVVILVSSVDLIVVLGIAGAGLAWSHSEAPAEQVWLFALGVVGLGLGLLVLRSPARLGPLDRIRSLTVFEGLRTVPGGRLAELFALRIAFAACFASICGLAFVAFQVPAPLPEIVSGVLLVAVVAALPIAVAGLGTSQAAFLYLFQEYASPETLLAMSLVITAGMLLLRAGMGVVFAREFTREALRETREAAA